VRSTAPFLALLAACSAAAGPLVPPPPPESGAALYVIEAEDGLLDDVSVDVLTRSPILPRAAWIGEQAFQIVLRCLARGKHARLISSARFEPVDGRESRVFLPRPVHYLVPAGQGRFELRRHPEPEGFEAGVKLIVSDDGKHVTVDYGLRQVIAVREKLPGTEFEAGEPVLEKVPLESGLHTIPLGATLLLPQHQGARLRTWILLRVASVARAEG
jgi:hypothetical protein